MAPTDHTQPSALEMEKQKEESKEQGRKMTRRQRRAYNKMMTNIQNNFGKLSESFVSSYFNLQVKGLSKDDLDKAEANLLDAHDRVWRNNISIFARKNEKHFSLKGEYKDKLAGRFIEFVEKFTKRKENLMSHLDVRVTGVEKMVPALKEIGVTTQAKTIEGVQKRVDKLTDDQKDQLIRLLSGES